MVYDSWKSDFVKNVAVFDCFILFVVPTEQSALCYYGLIRNYSIRRSTAKQLTTMHKEY